jgi:hypothetical protein
MHRLWPFLVFVLMQSSPAWAQVVTLTISTDPTGITLTGSGTPAAALAFGSVQAFGGTVPSGVTKSVGANSWTLDTVIDLNVQVTGLPSSSYTLAAFLLVADAQNTWKLKSVPFSTTLTTVTTSGAYGTTPYHLSLTVPFSAAAASITNTVHILVTSN